MRIRKFVQQVEHLLFTGAIEGEEVMRLLKAYAQGKISAEALQEVIDLLQNGDTLVIAFAQGLVSNLYLQAVAEAAKSAPRA